LKTCGAVTGTEQIVPWGRLVILDQQIMLGLYWTKGIHDAQQPPAVQGIYSQWVLPGNKAMRFTRGRLLAKDRVLASIY
jgi:hypothetical protein